MMGPRCRLAGHSLGSSDSWPTADAAPACALAARIRSAEMERKLSRGRRPQAGDDVAGPFVCVSPAVSAAVWALAARETSGQARAGRGL